MSVSTVCTRGCRAVIGQAQATSSTAGTVRAAQSTASQPILESRLCRRFPGADGDCVFAVDVDVTGVCHEKDLYTEGPGTVAGVHGCTTAPGLSDSHMYPVIGSCVLGLPQLCWIASALHGGFATMISNVEAHVPRLLKDTVGLEAMAVPAQRGYENFTLPAPGFVRRLPDRARH